MEKNKKITSVNMAFMAFMAVWGFGNIINGYRYYNGLGVIVMWILIFALYFVPYALMVGELGCAFKNEGGGVSSWINASIGKKAAYYAGWTYMIVHIPYLSQKPTNCIVGLSWLIYGDGRLGGEGFKFFTTGPLANIPTAMIVQILGLILFFVTILLVLRGINFLKKLSMIAGTAIFIMSILFVVMMIAAPSLNKSVSWSNIDFSPKTFLPPLTLTSVFNLSVLIFAVGGCEKLSPYVNKMKDPSKGFSKGMIILTILVAVCAILGTLSLGLLFNGKELNSEFITNGQYLAFAQVGELYGLGKSLMYIYCICNVIVNVAVMIVSVDAPLKMLLENADRDYIPDWLTVKNKNGVYKNGVLCVAILVAILIIIPALGADKVSSVVEYVIELNSICMPMRYLWVFVAYIALKKHSDKFTSEYKFVKNKNVGIVIGGWCFAITAFACCTKIFSEGGIGLIINILTPVVFILLGLILPAIAKKTNKTEKVQ